MGTFPIRIRRLGADPGIVYGFCKAGTLLSENQGVLGNHRKSECGPECLYLDHGITLLRLVGWEQFYTTYFWNSRARLLKPHMGEGDYSGPGPGCDSFPRQTVSYIRLVQTQDQRHADSRNYASK